MREFLVLDDEVRESSRCGMCGRPLENQRSRERGFGPVCYRKVYDDSLEIIKGVMDGTVVHHRPLVYHDESLQQSLLMEGEDG